MKKILFIPNGENRWIGFNPYTYELNIYDDENKSKLKDVVLEDKFSIKIRNAPEGLDMTMLNICMTETCNLNCSYCFANGGTYNNNEHNKMISLETMINSYNKLIKHTNSGIKVITFYGGEPLLAFPVIKEFVSFVSDKNKDIKFGLITNGTLLNSEVVDFLNNYNFIVTISLDGLKKYNDEIRISRDGSSTFDKVEKNLKLIKKRNFPMSAEATVSENYFRDYNKGDIYKFMEVFNSLGFDNVIPFAADISNGYSSEISDKICLFYKDVVNYSFEKLLTSEYYTVPSNVVSIIQAIASKKYINECLAGYKYAFLTINGDLYPCQLFYAAKKFKINDKDTDEYKIKEYVTRRNIPECQDCYCEGLCSLFCPGSSQLFNNNQFSVINTRCLVQRQLLKQVIINLDTLFKDKDKKPLLVKNLLDYSKYYSYKRFMS